MKKTLLSTTLLLLLSLATFAQSSGVRVRGGVSYQGRHGQSNQGGHGHGHYNSPNQKAALTQYGFRTAKQDILARNSHRGRLLMARQTADLNLLTSNQVKQIMYLLGTDADKVGFAKYAFPSVIDTERFYVVKGAVNYQSSRRELREFMRRQGIPTGSVSPGPAVSCGMSPCISAGVCGCSSTGGSGWSGSGGGSNGGGHYDNGPRPNAGSCGPTYGGTMVMHGRDFQVLKRRIKDTCFESTKEDIARRALRDNLFSSRQIKELMYMFTFESTKLDFAKAAYDRTVDQQRYFVVHETFTFESSIRRLNRFIYG